MKNETFTLENRKMEMQILYISDCCGAYLDDAQIQYGICNDCGEHCEVLTEEYPATPVCGGWQIKNFWYNVEKERESYDEKWVWFEVCP